MTKRRVALRDASDGYVIDASVTMPWFFPDEATPFTEDLLDSLGTQPIWAPALWLFECANVLQSAQRRKCIDAARRAEIAGELDELPVQIDQDLPNFVMIDRLAATHGLSAYDAAYFEFALRRALPLATLNARLLAAAKGLGHAVLTGTSKSS